MKIKPGADLRLSMKVEQHCSPEDVQEFVSLVKFCFAISPWTCLYCVMSFAMVDSEKCFEECWIKKIQNYLLQTLFHGCHRYNVEF